MAEKFLIALDGSKGAGEALKRALSLAKAGKIEVVLAHVIEWSAFSFHTPDELAERHKRREEELERAEAALLDPARAAAKTAGVTCTSVVRHGNPAEVLAAIAKEEGVSNIFVGRKGQSKMGALLFGSVAGSLIQISPVSVTVVP